MTYDVVIIGAGVVGALTARKLSSYDLKVCVVEKQADVACGASKANSAIVHGGFDPEEGTLKAKLNVLGASMMEKITKELDVHFINNGSLVVAFDSEQDGHIKKLYERGINNGVPGLSVLTGEQARALEPNLSENVTSALRCTSASIVCPYDLTIAAMGNAMDNGADLMLNFDTESIVYENGMFAVSDGKETVYAKYLVNCAGTGACKIAGMLGDNYTLTPKKGEYMLFDRSEGKTVSHTIFQVPSKVGKGILVTPTVDGNLLIGPTSVPSESDDKTTTADGLDFVKQIALKSVGTLNFRKIITSFTGVRASVSESADFVIDYSAKYENAVNTVGIDSPGLSSAPAIAEYVADMLVKHGLSNVKNESFNPLRTSCRHFEKLTDEEKNALIKERPEYGRVICRCETVTEGEILMAMVQNPKATTLDGVKRRTRSGMGRCQGGFCTPFITGLLAEKLGTDEMNVTKFGGKSRLLVGKKKA